MSIPFSSILIYGMGMMGSSLAHSIRRVSPKARITGVVRSPGSAAFLKEHSIADAILVKPRPSAIAEMKLEGYDLVVLGVPPHSIIEMAPHIPETGTLLTDMSSTRRSVHEALSKRPELCFAGSHPMCGSEKKGPEAGVPDLFLGNLCLLIEDDRFQVSATDRSNLRRFWEAVGMETHGITPDRHDRVLAYLSHSPHLLSSLLTLWADADASVSESSRQSPITITGGGFKSMARIAGSNPEMWADILLTNGDHILSSLKEFHAMLGDLIDGFSDRSEQDWKAWLKDSRKKRNFLCGYQEDA